MSQGKDSRASLPSPPSSPPTLPPGPRSSALSFSLERTRPPGRETGQRRLRRRKRFAIPRVARVLSWPCPNLPPRLPKHIELAGLPRLVTEQRPYPKLPRISYDGSPSPSLFLHVFSNPGRHCPHLESTLFSCLSGKRKKVSASILG